MHAMLISHLLLSPKSSRPKMTDVVPLVEFLLKKLDNYSHLVMFAGFERQIEKNCTGSISR